MDDELDALVRLRSWPNRGTFPTIYSVRTADIPAEAPTEYLQNTRLDQPVRLNSY
jgi:hypothetical protein